MRAFRILKNSIRDSFKSVFRNFSLSVASVMCTTITLILVAVSVILTANVNHVTDVLEKELTIVVYLDKDVSADEAQNIENKIKALSNVEEVTYKNKEEWKIEMKNYSEVLDNTLDYLGKNPLLDSFNVIVKNVEDLAGTASSIEKMDGIESANYGEGMVEEIISAFNIVKTATFVIAISLVVVTAFLVSNTIKLTIFSRRSEIEIMRLVGSSNTAIKLPFVFEGFLLGIVGSIIPVGITIYGYTILYERMGTSSIFGILELIKPMPFVLFVSVIILAIGAIVGMLGSLRAVRKYLKI